MPSTSTTAKYLHDADGHPKVQEFIRQVQTQDGECAQRCHELLGALTNDYGLG